MGRYTFRAPHELGMTAPPGTAGPPGAAGPARCDRTCPVPRLRSKSPPSPRAQFGWTTLIKETSVWSSGWTWDHMDQWVHFSGRSTATTVIPRPSSASLSEGGSSHSIDEGRSHLSTAMPTQTDTIYRPSAASGERIRSIQVERWWIIGPAAPPHPAAPMKTGPHAQLISLAYNRSLTPAGTDTQRWSISFPLFCSLRVGLV
jgi:hypothetical protein